MEIDLSRLEARHAHDLLASSVIPRPIAWVTTIGDDGKLNAAPFSFFTGVQWSPPVLAFSPVNRADGSKKDTVVNIEHTKEFVIHIISEDLLGAMESSAKPIPRGEDELHLHGIHFVASTKVRPSRIEEAKVAFECALERIVQVDEGADAGNLILGRVLLMHLRDDLLTSGGREVDWRGLRALGRLSGSRYCSLDSVFDGETN